MWTWNFCRAGKPLVVIGLCGLAWGLTPMPARGQVNVDLPAGIQPAAKVQAAANDNPDETQDNTSGVYVRDSAIAQEKIAQARRMQNLKEWNKSADLYQEILEKYPDRVVPSGTDASHKIVQYISVTEQVRQEICHWPAEGLGVYRSRYETAAAGLLKSARQGELENLHRILSLYFATDTAKTAALRLMDTYFEQGDYTAVQQIGQRMLDWHPNLLAERPGMLFRVALANQLCGNPDVAQHLLDELKSKFTTATGQIRGTDVVLADALDAQLKSDTRLVRGSADEFWPMLGGDPSRSKISPATGKPGAKLYSIELVHPTLTGAAKQQHESLAESGGLLGIMPVVDHDDLFFQDNGHLYAVSLETGVALPGWLATYPTSNGVYKLTHTAGLSTSTQLCVTVTEQNVVALMGLPDSNNQAVIFAMQNGQSVPNSSPARLVCLDRASGKEIWNVSVHDAPEKFSNLREVSLCGSPLVVGENIYIAGHGTKGGVQFEDCYALCFSLRDGSLRWVSYIASSSSGASMYMPNPAPHDTTSHLAYAGGSVFVSTELGAIASLDAFSGSILWLDVYREESVQQNNSPFMGVMNNPGMMTAQSANEPYLANPVIVQDGHVFSMPSDGKGVYIYDAANGKLLNKIIANDVVNDPVDSAVPKLLLGVVDDCVLVSSTSRLFNIPWRTFTTVKDAPDAYWASAPFTSNNPDSNNALRGRPFTTTTLTYVPTARALNFINLHKQGIKESDYPANGWDAAEQSPGNVLVSQDHVIVAGDRRVDVYTDLGMARRKLDQAVAAAPADPTPCLRYAEVMFAAGQVDIAQEKLTKAIELQGGADAIAAGMVRDRTFADALTFANRLIVLGKENADAAKINWFFEQAAHAAQTPSQNVTYRSAWARFAVANNDFARAVELYQTILGDDQMRVSPLSDPLSGSVAQAGVIAERAISDIKAKPEGLIAYKKYEDTADKKLAEARTALDASAMLAIARAFPNADCCRTALTEAAALYEKNSDPRHALLVLRQILLRYPKSEQLVTLQAMARNYLRLPNGVDAAAGRLSQAANLRPDDPVAQAFVLPDGTPIAASTLKDAQAQLAAYTAKLTSDSLPDLNIPGYQEWVDSGKKRTPFLPERPETVLNDIDALISPVAQFDRHDRFVTFTAGTGLAVYQPGQVHPLFTWAQITAKPQQCAWFGNNLAVWTDTDLVMLDTATGKIHWNLPTAAMQPIDIVADRDDNSTPVPPVQPIGRIGRGPMILRNNIQVVGQVAINGQVVAINPGGGVVNVGVGGAAPADAQLGIANGETIDKVVVLGQSIILTTSTGRVMAVETAGGAVIWQTRVSSRRIDRLLANDDFVVLRVKNDESGAIIALNTDTGDLVGRRAYQLGAQNDAINNLALGRDGSLVYVTMGQLDVVDLFDAHRANDDLSVRVASKTAQETARMFAACTEPDELLVHQGRIYAVTDDGSQVRIFSLETAKPWDYPSARPDAKPVPVLATRIQGSTSVKLHIVGSYLYVQCPNAFAAYNLQNPGLYWHTTQTLNLAGQVCGKNHLLLLNKPTIALSQAATNLPRSLTLLCYNRTSLPAHEGQEMGLQQFNPTLDAAVDTVLAIDGGIIYRTQDRQVHTLMGASGTLGTK